MQLINLRKAMMAPLQEKDAALKIGLYFGVNVLFTVIIIGISLVSGLIDKGRETAGIASLFSLLVCCFSIIGAVVLGAVNTWYKYQYTSAAFERRETTALWKSDANTAAKQAGKLYLVNFIYSLPVSVATFCVTFCVYIAFFATIIGSLSVATARGSSTDYGRGDVSALLSTMGIGALVICCVVIFLAILAFLYTHFIIVPAQLRMISTHTFGTAFKLGENWEYVRKNSGAFTSLALINIAIAFVVIFFYVVFYLLSFILIGIPFFIVTMLFWFYYDGIVSPYLSGDFYRNLQDWNNQAK